MIKRLYPVFLSVFVPIFPLLAGEVESLEISANTCEKALEGESPSSVRIRAVDKAVFLALKNLEELEPDRQRLSDYDFNAMVYQLVDDYVEDLSSTVTKSETGKICVDIKGYINPNNIEIVRGQFQNLADEQDQASVAQIADEVNQSLTIKPRDAQNLALVYINDLAYENGTTSHKYALFLKEKIKNNPYYYLTEEKDLADYVITPRFLKGKVDALDATHKRLQMVVVLDVDGLENDTQSIAQNRFLLFGAEENEQDIAKRLLKKLLEAAGQETVRHIERKEQLKLEQNMLGRKISDDEAI